MYPLQLVAEPPPDGSCTHDLTREAPLLPEPASFSHDVSVFRPDIHLHGAAADFAIIVQGGRQFVGTRCSYLKTLETARAGEFDEFHRVREVRMIKRASAGSLFGDVQAHEETAGFQHLGVGDDSRNRMVEGPLSRCLECPPGDQVV